MWALGSTDHLQNSVLDLHNNRGYFALQPLTYKKKEFQETIAQNTVYWKLECTYKNYKNIKYKICSH